MRVCADIWGGGPYNQLIQRIQRVPVGPLSLHFVPLRGTVADIGNCIRFCIKKNVNLLGFVYY